MKTDELLDHMATLDRGQLEFLVVFANGWEPQAVETAVEYQKATGCRIAQPANGVAS